MRLLLPSIVLLSFGTTIPVLSQSASPATTPAATTQKGPVDLTGFKEHIEEKNKALTDQVSSTKAIVKKNAAILQDAKRIDADNKRLAAERKALEAQNAEFARESQAMQSETTGVTVPTPPPAQPVRVEPVAPARVEPPPPARVETASAPRVESIAPARVAPVSAPAPQVNADDAVVVRAVDPGVTIAANAPIARPTANEPIPTAVVAAEAEPLRVSAGVTQGMLLAPIVPVYPSIAVTAHVQGEVVMEAVISKEGSIASVRAVSGPAMLRVAALDAVKVARYRPYRVNGQATDVAATIKVVFQLSR